MMVFSLTKRHIDQSALRAAPAFAARGALTCAMLLALPVALSGCNRGAPKQSNVVNGSQHNPGADQTVAIDTIEPGGNGLAAAANAGEARQLKMAAPDTADAAVETLHRAVAYIQTDRFADLQPLLAPDAKTQLAKAGGTGFLERYKTMRVEFDDKAVIDAAHVNAAIRFRLHPPIGTDQKITLGEAVLRRTEHGTATPWQIQSVDIHKDALPPGTR